MSMYRQLWLALILTSVIALAGALLASTLSARSYLQEQLRMKNSDNAAALALSLNRPQLDPVEIDLAVAALFDTGHYESIRVVDPQGQVVSERSAEQNEHGAPAWFTSALPLAAPPGIAHISDGWKQIGQITLSSHNRFAYEALWKSTLQMIAALACAGILGGFLGTSILRRLKRPLDTVIEQAKAITERRFITSAEPSVPELRQLASAMNFTVLRLKEMFDDEAARLESVRAEANHDALTGLANRPHFLARLGAALDAEETPASTLMLIRIVDIADINRRLGREATDAMLCALSAQLARQWSKVSDALAGRLNGSDFAVFLPGFPAHQIAGAADQATFRQIVRTFAGDDGKVRVAYGDAAYGMDLGTLLSQIDTALAEIEFSGNPVTQARIVPSVSVPLRNQEEWKNTLQRALSEGWTQLGRFTVADLHGEKIQEECPLRLRLEREGEWQPAGRFLPMAERLALTADIDLAALRLGLAHAANSVDKTVVAINISGLSLADQTFPERALSLLKSMPDAARKLAFEVSEGSALARLDTFHQFCIAAKAAGGSCGLKHIGRQFSQIGRFHGMPIDYLKIDASFIRGVDSHPGNQIFLKGLTGIAHGIGLRVIAQGVSTRAEWDALSGLGFDGATGPMVK